MKRIISRRSAIGTIACLGSVGLRAATRPPQVAVFRSDVTPEPGEPLIWTMPTAQVLDPLWAKGVVLEDGGGRYVLCAVDWCGLANSTYSLFRTKIARAAGTDLDRVFVHTVHQHTAPYIDSDAYALFGKLSDPPRRMSEGFLERVTDKLARAVAEAAQKLKPFDAAGPGEAKVERVASARRILADDGHVIVRWSGSGKDPALAALPEGAIDPMIRTVTIAAGGKPVVHLHYYATHPQTFCCDGRVTGDIVSTAREAVEKSEGVFQVYFTGCSGDVTVGKYNDGTVQAQAGMSKRLEQAMRASIRSARLGPVERLNWRTAQMTFPGVPNKVPSVDDLARMAADKSVSRDKVYQTAIEVTYAQRKRPFDASSFSLGAARILHLPGEPMLEFQKYARALRPGGFVAVAGYGDLSTGYVCTDRAWTEGGYEPTASNVGPGSEAVMKKAIRELLS